MRVADTLEFLAGDWRLHRVLTDHRSGADGSFTGAAIFAPPPGGPLRREWLPGGPLPGLAVPPGEAGAPTPPDVPAGTGPDPAELSYLEDGELRFGDHRGPASRSLRWIRLPGGAADVRFPDGRPFCLVDLRTGEWSADHPCGRDLYHVSYRVLSAAALEERWLVHGPGKDYRAVATLTRRVP